MRKVREKIIIGIKCSLEEGLRSCLEWLEKGMLNNLSQQDG